MLYKMEEWKSQTGWHCGCLTDLGHDSNAWWHPARIMKMELNDFIKWLIDNFNPTNIYHSDDCSFVGWSWSSQSEMRKFKNFINSRARQENYNI